MSKENLLKPFAIVIVGACFGFFSVKWFDQTTYHQEFSSIAVSKIGSEQFSKTLFDVKIKNDVLAAHNEDVSTLLVSVQAYQSFSNELTYTWNLPSNVTLVDGLKSSHLGAFSAGQTKEIQIKVKGYSKETKNYISFSVSGNVSGHPVSRDILVSSRPEDSFEYLAQETTVKPAKKKTASAKNHSTKEE